MSRLDSMIRRLEAQRACIDWALAEIHPLSGAILELGLGNGRTYDHLRANAPDRDIYVFERAPAAHPDCTPEAQYLIEGDFRETLQQNLDLLRGRGVLAHCDIGSGHPEQDRELAAAIAPQIVELLSLGALVLSDQVFSFSGWESVETPESVPEGRYYIYRKRELK